MRARRRLALALLASAAAAAACETTAPAAGDPAGATAPAPPPVVRPALPAGDLLPAYQRVELDNGAVLLLLEKPDVPMIGFQALLRGGAVADPADQPGVSSLLAELLRKGAGDRDAAGFAAAVEGVGGSIATSSGLESVQISGEFLSRDAELMIELLADMLRRPRLSQDEFVKLRDRAGEFIRAAKDSSPNGLVPIYAAAFLYGGDHPYGRPASGDESSLAQLTIDDVRRYYREHIGADRLILAVAGDFDSEAIVRSLRSAFGDWRGAGAALPEYPSAPRQAGGRVLLIDKPDATQTWFWLGNVGVSRYYPRRAELSLANTVFGGRFTSMLNTELRIKSGLTYGASSRLSRPLEAGTVGVTSFTRTETTAQAIDLAVQTLERLRVEGLDEPALSSARSYTLGQYPLAFETARQLARQMVTLAFYGFDDAYVNDYPSQVLAARSDEVGVAVSEVYPAADELVYVMIGNASAIREVVAKYGAVTEVPIDAPTFRVGAAE